jgi:peptide chain release factor 1
MIDYNKIRQEHEDISHKLSLPETLNDQKKYQELAKRFSFLAKLITMIDKRDGLVKALESLKETVANPQEDQELKTMAQDELERSEQEFQEINDKIEDKLFEQSEPDRDFMIEIRAAVGGEEAALFAGVLFNMYCHYVEKQGWLYEVMSMSPTDIGGFKEVIFSVKGEGAYQHLKFEMGVHRVQRVPETEASGRIHTSTVTVAVLVEPQEVELNIRPEDLKVDTYRASGAGGQHVNRTDSAVRITHLPTGTIVACQEERSQMKNRSKAMRLLKVRILEEMQSKATAKFDAARKTQIGSGDRSEKIRTYNYPERRVTDHRINFTIYRLEQVLEGDMDEVVKALRKAQREKFYAAQGLVKQE